MKSSSYIAIGTMLVAMFHMPRAQSQDPIKELNVSIAGHALGEAIRASRNSSIGQTKSIPAEIRARLQDFYPDDVLDRARYKVGDNGIANVARNTLFNPKVAAVTLDDIVVFQTTGDAEGNWSIWAHELKHVSQYSEWGVHSFAVQYVRDSGRVESAAYEYQGRVDRALNKQLGAGCSTAREAADDLYLSVLGRTGDAAGVRQHALLINISQYSVRSLVAAFAHSEEYINTFNKGRTDEDIVRSLYKHVLGREGDALGIAVNVNALARIGYPELVNAFVNSAEYLQNFGEWTVPSMKAKRTTFCS